MDKVRECAIAELKELQSEMELAERVKNKESELANNEK